MKRYRELVQACTHFPSGPVVRVWYQRQISKVWIKMLKQWKVMIIIDLESILDLEYILPNPNDDELIYCVLLALDLEEYGKDWNYGLGSLDQTIGLGDLEEPERM